MLVSSHLFVITFFTGPESLCCATSDAIFGGVASTFFSFNVKVFWLAKRTSIFLEVGASYLAWLTLFMNLIQSSYLAQLCLLEKL